MSESPLKKEDDGGEADAAESFSSDKLRYFCQLSDPDPESTALPPAELSSMCKLLQPPTKATSERRRIGISKPKSLKRARKAWSKKEPLTLSIIR